VLGVGQLSFARAIRGQWVEKGSVLRARVCMEGPALDPFASRDRKEGVVPDSHDLFTEQWTDFRCRMLFIRSGNTMTPK